MSLLRATRSHAVLLLAGTLIGAVPAGSVAAAQRAPVESDGVVQLNNGTLFLAGDAAPAPRVMGDFARFGLWDSSSAKMDKPFQAVRVEYSVDQPIGTQSLVAVRASVDGRRWGEWEWNVSNGAVVTFGGAQQWIQQRIVLLGSPMSSPIVSALAITPTPALTAKSTTYADGIAPTYRLRVTRQGMVGRRTANGHRITKYDIFVSLPSWKVLSSKEGSEYMVRLSANGRSVIARVADVGPWNSHDNYWDVNRATYKDLPVGWPEDHAAYYENYNHRRAERGRVRTPTAVDIGDGAYWALGLGGGQATVDVTFLWLGQDPGPNPEPRNSAPSRRP